MSKLLGFQLADRNGENIQGDESDPTGFASFEVMSPSFAIQWVRGNCGAMQGGGFLLMPIYEGDIEEPTVVTGER